MSMGTPKYDWRMKEEQRTFLVHGLIRNSSHKFGPGLIGYFLDKAAAIIRSKPINPQVCQTLRELMWFACIEITRQKDCLRCMSKALHHMPSLNAYTCDRFFVQNTSNDMRMFVCYRRRHPFVSASTTVEQLLKGSQLGNSLSRYTIMRFIGKYIQSPSAYEMIFPAWNSTIQVLDALELKKQERLAAEAMVEMAGMPPLKRQRVLPQGTTVI